jgi:hypothetical protein
VWRHAAGRATGLPALFAPPRSSKFPSPGHRCRRLIGCEGAGESVGGKAGTFTIAYLGVLASLQLVDPTVAITALVQAGRSLGMEDATLTLAASVSTLAQAACWP